VDERFAEPAPAAQENAAMPYQPDAEPAADQLASVLARNSDRLMAIDGVEGCGVGQDDAGNPVLLVYLRDEQARQRLPTDVEGHRLHAVITGAITAY
jgi:hypothetical protein